MGMIQPSLRDFESLVRGKLLSKIDEFLEARRGFSRPYRFPGELDSFAQAGGFPAYRQTGGCIQKNHVLFRAAVIGENVSYNLGVLPGISALDLTDGRARNAKILGGDIVGADFAIPYFGDLALSAYRDFVKAV